MDKVGRYCKFYPIARFREFPGWKEKKVEDDGTQGTSESPLLLCLQEDHTVTESILLRQAVVFDEVTPEWIEFCKTVLQFEPPSYAS